MEPINHSSLIDDRSRVLEIKLMSALHFLGGFIPPLSKLAATPSQLPLHQPDVLVVVPILCLMTIAVCGHCMSACIAKAMSALVGYPRLPWASPLS